MKKSDIYEVTIKILGLYLFATTAVSGVNALIYAFYFVAQSRGLSDIDWAFYMIIAIVNFALPIFISLFLFFKAKFLVRKICSSSDFEESVIFFAEPKKIYEMSLIITGLLLIIWTLPEFSFKLKNYIEAKKFNSSIETRDLNFMWIAITKILIGTFLLLLARQIARYFGKDRNESLQ